MRGDRQVRSIPLERLLASQDTIEARVIVLIRVEMARAGLTGNALCAAIGMHPKSLSNRMVGITRFTIADLYTIAEALGTHPRAFLP